jgi:ribose 5-phosphate isomerase B
MSSKVVAFASDHAGFELKALLLKDVEGWGYPILDLGTDSLASVDYPDYGKAMADAIGQGRAWLGVLVCGSGIGISIAANRNPTVRAALCHNGTVARLSRLHNDANVIALGARLVGQEVARDCVKVFLETEFEGGRHAGRVAKLAVL